MNIHREAIVALDKKGLRPCQIMRKLRLSKGTVCGTLWRERNPWKKVDVAKKAGPPKQYSKICNAKIDECMHENIDYFAKEMDVHRSEAIRMLITFGLESLEGE